MVIHHVDDALHAPVVDGVHQMAQVVHGAHVGVHRPVIPDGIGAAHGALTALLADGVNGHQPQDIRTQRFQAVEIALQRTERALLGVSSNKHAVDHLPPQGEIGVNCHKKALLFEYYCSIERNSSSVSTGIFNSCALRSLLPAFSPATT